MVNDYVEGSCASSLSRTELGKAGGRRVEPAVALLDQLAGGLRDRLLQTNRSRGQHHQEHAPRRAYADCRRRNRQAPPSPNSRTASTRCWICLPSAGQMQRLRYN
jgi:hypothetical protein